jgi:dihydrolipoamide dehydrogenase
VGILGSGPGGYVAALRAGILGLKTVLVEKDPLLGGTCLHRGCIPTKALLHTAELADTIAKAKTFGIEVASSKVEFAKVQSRKKRIVRKLAKGIEALMKKRGVEVIRGEGRVISPNRLSVETAEGERIVEAKHLIVATGSEPAGLPGLEPDGRIVLNSDHILEIDRVPESLLVVGGGAVGVEFASIFASFGSRVTLVEILPRILPTGDEEVASELSRALRARGIEVLTQAKVARLDRRDDHALARIETTEGERSVEVERMLVSVGRRPRTVGVGLEEAGVEVDEKGFVRVNEFMQTTAEGVYAIGDIVPTAQLAHLASAEGILAVDHLAGRPVRPIDPARVPSCVYSHPEAASVGLTEAEAKEKGYAVKVGKFPFAASGKASILDEGKGFVKIVADARYGEVLGVHMVGPRVTELVAEATALLSHEATVESLVHTIHAHPTLAETLMEAAHDVYGQAIHF